MSDATLADIRALLEEERDRLEQRLADLGGGLDGAPDGSLAFERNFADSSAVTAERGEVEAVVGSLKDSLAEVCHALEKLDNGTFGACETCGAQIAPARLEAKPDARYCIEHATRR